MTASGNVTSRMSKSKRAGLAVSVARIDKRIKNANVTARVGGLTSVYTAGVIEYFLTELIKEAGYNVAKAGEHHRITPEDIMKTLRNDTDVHRIFASHRVLSGNPLKKVSKEMILEADKKYQEKVEELKKKKETAK